MKYLKKWLLPVLLLLGVIAFFAKLSDLENFVSLIQQGSLIGILISFALGLAIIFLQAKLIQILYGSFSVNEKITYLILVLLGMNFANAVLPSVGFSGVSLFVAEAKAKNIKIALSFCVSLLYFFFYFLSFSLILLFVILLLLTTTKIAVYQILGAIVFGLILLFLATFLYNISHSKARSLKIMTFLVAFANTPYRWLKNKSIINQTHLEDLAKGMYEKLDDFKKTRSSFVIPFLYGLAIHLINILMLAFIFLAFNNPVSLTIAIVGFSMAVLFSLVSITPSGVGFVEGIMILVFRSFGVELEIALIVTLVYRGFQFWLPFLLGLYATRKMQISGND